MATSGNPCNFAANLEVGTPWEGCQQYGGHARCRSLGWSSYKVGVARTRGVQSLLQLWEVELDCLVCCYDQHIWATDDQFGEKWRGLFVVRSFPYYVPWVFSCIYLPFCFPYTIPYFPFPHVYTLGLSQMFFYQDTFSPSLLENIPHL